MTDQTNPQNRAPQQQDQNPQQRSPQQQNEQRDRKDPAGERVDTDGDGRTRDPNDTRPTDDGGRGEPVQR